MPANLRPVLILDLRPVAAVAASPESVDFTATCPMVFFDANTVASATQGGGTAQPQRQALGAGGFNAMTNNAILLDTAGNVLRLGAAATFAIVVAQRTIAPTDVIRGVFTTNNANGNLYCHFVLTPVVGA